MAEFKVTPDEIEFEVMLREPYFTDITSGEVTPLVSAMGWSKVPVKYHDDCTHEHTVCDTCADDWMMDHYVRISVPGQGVLYLSPDAPQSPTDE